MTGQEGADQAADVAVVGSGAAGLSTALAAAAAGLRVLVVTKASLRCGSSAWAQGGLAAALAPDDTVGEHVADTVAAGAGLCDVDAVRDLVADFPEAVRALVRLGVRLDAAPGGVPATTREGGHRRRRIVHAGGDASGAELVRVLARAIAASPVQVAEDTLALRVLLDGRRDAAGVLVAPVGTDGTLGPARVVRAAAVVLATGGLGQAYALTTNPDVATGDGVALALRAGAEVADLEFVQFHPTALYAAATVRAALPGRPLPLVSEAVRGEGAILVDATGRPVMAGVHPMADLAPRDVVSAAVARRLAQSTGGAGDHVFLDGTRLGAAVWRRRFPTVLASCRAAGVDPVRQAIPVTPAAHYSCGGIRTTVEGCTSVPGLYAVGEVAATGLHGANRLASNSLPEALVTGTRLGRLLGRTLDRGAVRPARQTELPADLTALLEDPGRRQVLAAAMTRGAGVLRDADGLRHVEQLLAEAPVGATRPTRAAVEAGNLRLVSRAIVHAATLRCESRGCHQRCDHPDPRETWRGHLVLSLRADGAFTDRLATVRTAA